MSLLPQPTSATQTSTNNPNAGGGRLGGVGGFSADYEYGTVIQYNCDTYTAQVHGSKSGPMSGVAQLRQAPGDISPLENGTEVLISHAYGEPLILGVVTRSTKKSVAGPKYSATGVSGFGGQGENKDIQQDVGNYRGATEPDDLMPGDWSRMTRDGNGFTACTGGVNVMRSSEMCQIRTHQQNDLMEVIARNYRQINDMGEYSVRNNGGKINLRFRGGSDQSTEAGPDEENYSVKLDIGSEGDMFNFELTAPQGQTLFKLHVSADGECEIYGINGVSINSGNQNGGTSVEESNGNKVKVIQGNQTVTIVGSNTADVGGDDSTTVTGDKAVAAGNDIRHTAVRDVGISAGRAMYVSATGALTGNAMSFDIESGNWVVDIGSPTSLQPTSGFKMTTFNGDVDFTSLVAGNFNFNTPGGAFTSRSVSAKFSTYSAPDSVILGGETITSHVVKYEQLQLMMMTLFKMLDTHSHQIPPGAAVAGFLPVAGITGIPLFPAYESTLSNLLQLSKSVTTGVQL